jgi:outer membrane autotransporter protein
MIKALRKALAVATSIGRRANFLKRFALVAVTLVCWATIAPNTASAQDLHIDNNATVTEAVGSVTRGTVVAGFNSGTVNGVPGGTYIVPTGANVTLSGLFAGFASNSTGLIEVNGGNITTTNPQSQYYTGFNGSGMFVVSNGGTVLSLSQSYVGYNAGSSGLLTVEGQGSSYTNMGFFLVGNGGTGQLNVLNGGEVSSPGGTLQIGANNTGTALVSGPGSSLSAGTFLGVGVNPGSAGDLTITNGGMATSGSGTYLAFNSGSTGTISVSNGGLLTSPLLVVGSSGTGNLQVQSNGAVSISGPAIVGAVAGTSSVEVSGAAATLTVQNHDLIVGGQGNGTMMISDQGTVTVTGTGNTSIAGQCGAGLASFCATPVQGGTGAVTVTGPGSVLNAGVTLTIGQFGAGTLTIANSAQVFADPVVIAQNAGSTGTLNIGAAAGSAPVAPGSLNTPTVTFGAGTGDIVFNHTDGHYVFAPAISGTGAVDVFSGNTVMTGPSNYSGVTTIHGGILSAGAANVFSPNSNYAVQTGGTLNLNDFPQTVASLSNAGHVIVGNGTPPGDVLTTTNYVGQGGTLHLDTFLGTDGSPSDKLVINGGSATGNSFVRITNVGGPGVVTTGNGILVVETTSGGTTTPNAFALAGEARGGALDFYLFRGGLNGSDPQDWFLRSSFIVGPGGPVQPIGPTPPPEVLPPGIYPIIGPELATYGVVQPIARQMGLTTLGTVHERIGDAAADAACLSAAAIGGSATSDGAPVTKPPPVPDGGCRPPVWGRLFGQQIDNHYQAFADPRATGQVAGIQSGADVWRGNLIPGHTDTAGLYFAYGNGNVGVDGLVTNPAATGYILQHTGSVNLNAYSLGGYWTHYGPTGWYIDAVLQGSFYNGNATTQFANLPISGTGFTSSLEAGYPIPLPWFGPRFVLEPEGQIIWQQVSLRDDNDGLGPVGLGTTSGATGRLGLRGKWTISDPAGRVWQPYVLANVWRDWGANATTMFGPDPVPLLERATRLEFAGGLSAKLLPGLSLYAQAGYQFAVSGTDGGRRDGVKGDFGAHYTW